MSNLDRLKAAYKNWDASKGVNLAEWGGLLAENVRFGSIQPRPSLEFAGDRKSRAEVVDYLGRIFEQWEMVHFTPKTFVEEGQNIAVFSDCAYRNRATGKVAELRIAHLWEFGGGAIVRLAEIFDTADAAVAATPD